MVRTVTCDDTITRKYFRDQPSQIRDFSRDKRIEQISIAWDGEIIDSKPSLSKKILYRLNEDN
ncbi:MAG: hypothetical protein JSW73_02110 [Candidatus Woesearchaeota archaeon]|nr:MAG: hypothetical protein JSW73_02110 [Candidatus Woesearchaeota archaeon]